MIMSIVLAVLPSHFFLFPGLSWSKLLEKQIDPPFKPPLVDDYDVSHFDKKVYFSLTTIPPFSSCSPLCLLSSISISPWNSISPVCFDVWRLGYDLIYSCSISGPTQS